MHPQKYDSVCYRWVSRENLDYKKWAVYGSDDSNKQSSAINVIFNCFIMYNLPWCYNYQTKLSTCIHKNTIQFAINECRKKIWITKNEQYMDPMTAINKVTQLMSYSTVLLCISCHGVIIIRKDLALAPTKIQFSLLLMSLERKFGLQKMSSIWLQWQP